MFRKLVSNIAFSPALVGQLGFYAKRLRKEETTRRVGLVFMALALVAQSFAVFQPPESANAASSQDIIYGGFSTKEQMIGHYDKNTGNFKDLLSAVGITREELQATTLQSINSKGVKYSFGRNPTFSYAQGERRYDFPTSSGTTATVYYHPLALWDTLPYTIQNGSTYQAYGVRSAKAGYFWIMLNCGNLNLLYPPQTPPCPSGTIGTYPSCTTPPKMCTITGKETLLVTDPNCKVSVTPMCTVAGKENLPASDPNCKTATTTQMCKVTGKENLIATDPNCRATTVTPMCTVTGKENLLATDPNCKAPVVTAMCKIPGKENLPADSPSCKYDSIAACESLTIDKVQSDYRMNTVAYVANGAYVKSYTYTIKQDGKVVQTHTNPSSSTNNSYVHTTTTPGAYSVEVVVNTSIGDRSSGNCAKTFSVIKPVQMCALNPSLQADSPECQPCPGDGTLWIKNPACAGTIIKTKQAKNASQGSADATKVNAQASDKIVYTLIAENTGKNNMDADFVEQLTDVLEYATITEKGGATYSESAKTLTWPTVSLKPGEKQTRMFTVQLLSKIPAMAQGNSSRTSYDCRISNVFGNMVSIAVSCPAEKQIVEQTVAQLPHTGAGLNMALAGISLMITTYFYARSRQIKKEVRLIRRDLNTGTL